MQPDGRYFGRIYLLEFQLDRYEISGNILLLLYYIIVIIVLFNKIDFLIISKPT